MAETVTLPDLNLEEELSSGDLWHRYVVCSICFNKQVPGAMVDTLCGKVIRLPARQPDQDCQPCAKVLKKVRPADVRCTFCGHIGK